MTSSRDRILQKLRKTAAPFPDAPPRPKQYVPVTRLDPDEDLLARFTAELERLDGEVFLVKNDEAACKKVVELLRGHAAETVLAWDFKYIPVDNLETDLKAAGITAQFPDIHTEERADLLEQLAAVPVGLTGADAAAATTGSLVVSTAAGKGRIPTVLPRVHIAIIHQEQIVPRLEDWVAQQRIEGLTNLQAAANWCFISGPSRTADIEKNLVLGMHGPEQLQVIIKQS